MADAQASTRGASQSRETVDQGAGRGARGNPSARTGLSPFRVPFRTARGMREQNGELQSARMRRRRGWGRGIQEFLGSDQFIEQYSGSSIHSAIKHRARSSARSVTTRRVRLLPPFSSNKKSCLFSTSRIISVTSFHMQCFPFAGEPPAYRPRLICNTQPRPASHTLSASRCMSVRH